MIPAGLRLAPFVGALILLACASRPGPADCTPRPGYPCPIECSGHVEDSATMRGSRLEVLDSPPYTYVRRPYAYLLGLDDRFDHPADPATPPGMRVIYGHYRAGLPVLEVEPIVAPGVRWAHLQAVYPRWRWRNADPSIPARP